MANTFMMAISEEDDSIRDMSKFFEISKSEVVILALNLLAYVKEQRRNGVNLAFSKNEDKTKDILTEACANNVPFKLNAKTA